MKFPSNTKLELATWGDKHDQRLADVYLDCQDTQPVLVATTRHILAVVPVEAQPDEQGYVTGTALKAARKLAKKAAHSTITCNGTLQLTDGTAYPRPTEESEGKGLFPNWRGILPAPDRPVTMRIGINAVLLSQLAEALGTEEVILEIDNPLHIISVKPCKSTDGRRGVIMPIKV